MKRSLSFLRLISLVLILFGRFPVVAAIRTVTNLNDSGDGSLRGTIAVAGSGDTINFAVTGTILLTSGELSNQSKNLTIDNPSGPDFIRVERSGFDSFRIFHIEGGTVVITGLTITNGRTTICLGGSDVCSGGGVYNEGTLTLINCVITGNEAFYGGGIGNASSLTLTDCTIENNSASGGTQSSHGGGIVNQGTLTASRCTINDNDGKAAGGAIYNDLGTATLINCTLFENSAATGGALVNLGSMAITSCTISRNGSFSFGGGRVYNLNGNLSLRNTILETGFGAYNANLAVNQGTITSLGYNLSNDDGNGFLTATGDQINVNPQFDPYGLRYESGYTKTIALTVGSPAIDKGNGFGLTTDQRGHPRPVDNPFVSSASGGDGSDIGAYETPSDTTQSATNLIVTTSNDHDDGVCGSLDCSLREAIQRANMLPGANTIILDGSLAPTIALQTQTLGELVVSDSVLIAGPDARSLALSSDGYNRIFSFLGGSNTITGLTIRDGWSANSSPGGLALGGGIYNQAILTINDCSLSENRVSGGGASSPGGTGGSGIGAGIYNVGTLSLNRCSFIHNGAFGGSGAPNAGQFGIGGTGGAAQGSAVFNGPTGVLAVNNCSLFNNVVNGGSGANGGFLGGNGGSADGTLYSEGTMTVTASTLRDNNGSGGTRGLGNSTPNHGVNGPGRGGLVASLGTTTVRNTISASNIVSGFMVSVDVHGNFISDGHNLIGNADNSTGFTHVTDQTGTYSTPLNPLLGPMQNNGGPTDTMALLYGSPAIDRGKNFGFMTDQRGVARVVDTLFANAVGGDGSDIGAVEMNLVSGPDSDGDGMSDDFERFFGVNDPNADPDSDGQNNLAEFQARTNPLVAELFITAVSVNGTNVTVSFKTAVAFTAYRLERKSVITDVWGAIPGLADFTALSTGPAQITDVGGGSAARQFYRIRLLP